MLMSTAAVLVYGMSFLDPKLYATPFSVFACSESPMTSTKLLEPIQPTYEKLFADHAIRALPEESVSSDLY